MNSSMFSGGDPAPSEAVQRCPGVAPGSPYGRVKEGKTSRQQLSKIQLRTYVGPSWPYLCPPLIQSRSVRARTLAFLAACRGAVPLSGYGAHDVDEVHLCSDGPQASTQNLETNRKT